MELVHLNVVDRKFVQSSKLVVVVFFFNNRLSFPNVYYQLFPRWIREKNPTDVENVPSGVPGYQLYTFHAVLYVLLPENKAATPA